MFPIFGNPFPIFGNPFPIFENSFPIFGNLFPIFRNPFPIIGNFFSFLLETFSFHLEMFPIHLEMFPIHLEMFPIQIETFLNRLETNVDQIMLCGTFSFYLWFVGEKSNVDFFDGLDSFRDWVLANVVEDLTRARFGEENVNGLVGRIRRLLEVFHHLRNETECVDGRNWATSTSILHFREQFLHGP